MLRGCVTLSRVEGTIDFLNDLLHLEVDRCLICHSIRRKNGRRAARRLVVTAENDRAPQHYGRRDILAMYPALRLDHLRYLEKCGLIKPRPGTTRRAFSASAISRRCARLPASLQQGAPFRAVVRNLQASRTGQLTFDFRLEAQPARIIELKPRTQPNQTLGTPGTRHPWHLGRVERGRAVFPDGLALDDGPPSASRKPSRPIGARSITIPTSWPR